MEQGAVAPKKVWRWRTHRQALKLERFLLQP
jgi:hypothetical protein